MPTAVKQQKKKKLDMEEEVEGEETVLLKCLKITEKNLDVMPVMLTADADKRRRQRKRRRQVLTTISINFIIFVMCTEYDHLDYLVR